MTLMHISHFSAILQSLARVCLCFYFPSLYYFSPCHSTTSGTLLF